jgi:hypothetical protein
MTEIEIDFTGLPVEAALEKAQRAMGREFAARMARLENQLIHVGATHDEIDALVCYARDEFAVWLRDYLSGLREWLLECDRETLH